MKTLIVEDDFTCRTLLQALVSPYGESHIAVNGNEALQAWRLAARSQQPYDLICLDIIMPGMDGQAVLNQIRSEEQARGVVSTRGTKIIMTTSLRGMKNISN